MARLQGVPGGGTNVNVNCITKHTDIFFSLGQHFDSYLTSCSARKEMLVIETQFCCALRMCVCVCEYCPSACHKSIWGSGSVAPPISDLGTKGR